MEHGLARDMGRFRSSLRGDNLGAFFSGKRFKALCGNEVMGFLHG